MTAHVHKNRCFLHQKEHVHVVCKVKCKSMLIFKYVFDFNGLSGVGISKNVEKRKVINILYRTCIGPCTVIKYYIVAGRHLSRESL